jgi:hypothetical protein
MDAVWIGEWICWPLVYIAQYYILQITDTETSVLSLLHSPLTVSWPRLLPREIFQLPVLRSSCHSRPCRTLVNWQLKYLGARLAAISHKPLSLLSTGWLSTDNWQLNSFTDQADTSRHLTHLNCWQLHPTTNSLLQTFLITSRHGPHRKHCFHCYSPTLPRPLHRSVCLFAYCIATAIVYRVTV